MGILDQHIASDLAEHYRTVESMTSYEVENKLTQGKVNGIANGSRTLLRLHRALDFIIAFLVNVCRCKDDESLSTPAVEAYNNTLANYHGWLIRKAATLALYTLGNRTSILSAMPRYSRDETLDYIGQLIKSAQAVYDHVQTVYTDKGILDLP